MSPEQAGDGGLDVDTRTRHLFAGRACCTSCSAARCRSTRQRCAAPATTRSSGSSARSIRRGPARAYRVWARTGRTSRRSPDRSSTRCEGQLRSELEWIPLKAMRKAPADRYSSATELADDVANYLANRPLRAGPESAAYRAESFSVATKPAWSLQRSCSCCSSRV